MLAMEHALDHPAGLRGLVVADSPASMTLWVSEANRLRNDLPKDVQETLTRHENAGTTDDPDYEAAVAVFYARHPAGSCQCPTASCARSRRSPPTRPCTTP
jgi:L-proline amide hydrolase